MVTCLPSELVSSTRTLAADQPPNTVDKYFPDGTKLVALGEPDTDYHAGLCNVPRLDLKTSFHERKACVCVLLQIKGTRTETRFIRDWGGANGMWPKEAWLRC